MEVYHGTYGHAFWSAISDTVHFRAADGQLLFSRDAAKAKDSYGMLPLAEGKSAMEVAEAPWREAEWAVALFIRRALAGAAWPR